MQRLFSMFPSGRAGAALLLLRVGLSILLLDGVLGPLSRPGSYWVLSVPWVAAIGLCLGLMTPLFALLSVVIVAGAVLALGASVDAVHACAALEAVAIALLGPGAYSLDARIFGRRRIVLPHPEDGGSGE